MNLAWIDLEMTGLDPDKDKILEIAVIITDHDLNIVDQGLDLVVHWDDKVLENMNEWCTEHHGSSGLTESVRNSTLTIQQAEKQVLSLVRQYCTEKQTLLCGNSIWLDKLFLMKQMPKLYDFFHYRIIDVSTVKELVARWYPNLVPPMKKETHRALEDIKESIEELKFYKDKAFKQI